MLKDGDIITIDANKKTLHAEIGDSEWKKRRNEWVAPALKASYGILYKYAQMVTSASEGCVTDEKFKL